MDKPFIGVTGRPFSVPASTGQQVVHGVLSDYLDGLVDAGGIPVILPQQTPRDARQAVTHLDGLMFTGGGDVNPARYGGSGRAVRAVDDRRDAWELALAAAAREASLPTLAICRGIQVLNVAFGGSLWEDLATEYPNSEPHDVIDQRAFDGHQAVRVQPGSRLADVIGPELVVNSIHHQAVKELAPGFCAVAWAPDGVIEAMEPIASGWDLTAVQWHPEYLENGRTLFEWIVETAAGQTTSGRSGQT